MTRVQAIADRLSTFEIFLIALLAAGGVASSRLLLPVLVVALLFALLRWAGHGIPTIRTPADWPVALLVLMLGVSLTITALPEVTQPQVLRVLAGIALFYAVVNWATSPQRLHWLLRATALLGLALAVGALFTVSWRAGKLLVIAGDLYAAFPAIIDDTVNPNIMAGQLVILLPYAAVVLALDRRVWGWASAILLGLACAIILGVLLLTQSRGAMMALAAMVTLFVLLGWRRGWAMLLAWGLVAAAGWLWLDTAVLLELLLSDRAIAGYEGRIEIWSRALYMIQDFPFTGIGMGLFTNVADLLYPFFLSAPDTVTHAHNLFLQVAVDVGIPGLIAWLSVLLLVIAAGWQTYRRGAVAGDRPMTAVGLGIVSSQVALVVHGLTDAATWGTRPAIIVWGLWAIAFAAYRLYVPLPRTDEPE